MAWYIDAFVDRREGLFRQNLVQCFLFDFCALFLVGDSIQCGRNARPERRGLLPQLLVGERLRRRLEVRNRLNHGQQALHRPLVTRPKYLC